MSPQISPPNFSYCHEFHAHISLSVLVDRIKILFSNCENVLFVSGRSENTFARRHLSLKATPLLVVGILALGT